MTANQLRKLLDAAVMTQMGAARDLGISDRNMRRYVSGDLPVPRHVELALLRLVERSHKRVVGIETLTARELESFNAAVDAARGNLPNASGFIHCEPVRDEHGRFSALRVYNTSLRRTPIGVVAINRKGEPETVDTTP
jgi:hypothetical protein